MNNQSDLDKFKKAFPDYKPHWEREKERLAQEPTINNYQMIVSYAFIFGGMYLISYGLDFIGFILRGN